MIRRKYRRLCCNVWSPSLGFFLLWNNQNESGVRCSKLFTLECIMVLVVKKIYHWNSKRLPIVPTQYTTVMKTFLRLRVQYSVKVNRVRGLKCWAVKNDNSVISTTYVPVPTRNYFAKLHLTLRANLWKPFLGKT